MLNEALYFEDFKPGKKFHSKLREISAGDIDGFAELSGDRNPIHVSQEVAKSSIYGQRIAHGILTLSMVSGLAVEMGIADRTTIAFRSLEWRFKRAVMIGDTVRAQFTVKDKKEVAELGGGLVIFQIKVFNQKHDLVQTGKWTLLIRSRSL